LDKNKKARLNSRAFFFACVPAIAADGVWFCGTVANMQCLFDCAALNANISQERSLASSMLQRHPRIS